MTAIQLRSIILFTILLLIITCCNCQSDDSCVSSSQWAKMQISPDSLSSLKYGNFHIEIYEHINNHKTTTTSEKKYFYSPIALLDHKNAFSRFNKVTKKQEMRFSIEMWNDQVENEVVQHLKQIVGSEIQPYKVRVFPLENVILISNTPTEGYSLSPVWTHYDKSKKLRLSLSCDDKKICDELENEMQSDPEQFAHLKLLYSFSSQTSQTKVTIIPIDSVTSSRMVTNLLQIFGSDQNYIFLTSDDEKKMLAETSTNIRMNIFDDSEIGTPDTDTQFDKILKDLFETFKMTNVELELGDKMWDSVYWSEDGYRPDNTTIMLNEINKKLDAETQKKLADMFQQAERQSEKTEKLASIDKIREELDKICLDISWILGNDTDSSSRVEISKENLEKLLEKSRDHVQWDGEKFVPKPMQLSRIKLGKFRNPQLFEEFKVRVRYVNADLFVPIKFAEHSELTVTDEWKDLKKEFNANTELLNKTMKSLFETTTNLNDLTTTFIENQQELNNTKTELAETIITFTNNINDISEKLNATELKLAETNTNATDLSLKLKETILELEKTRKDLNKKIDDSARTLNENSQILTSKVESTERYMKGKLDVTLKQLETVTKNVSEARTEFISTKSAYEDSTKKFNEHSQRLGKELKDKEDSMRKELIGILQQQLDNAKKNFNETIRTELNSTKSVITDLTKKLNARTSELVDIGKMPTSCSDLQRMGHKLSGFFSVKGLTKMEMVHCDFNLNQNVKQKLIGYTDVKSASVHFYVQRSSSFSSNDSPILFDSALVNEGNAMDLKTGIFTAPQSGTYFFSFTGLMQFASSSSRIQFAVGLYLNRNQIGRGSVDEGNIGENPNDQVTLQSMLKLEKGDEVCLKMTSISGGALLFDDNNHHTHFTGFMLEEEGIVSTL